eukprot:362952-Chlamydomonas_euryale.AAC.8
MKTSRGRRPAWSHCARLAPAASSSRITAKDAWPLEHSAPSCSAVRPSSGDTALTAAPRRSRSSTSVDEPSRAARMSSVRRTIRPVEGSSQTIQSSRLVSSCCGSSFGSCCAFAAAAPSAPSPPPLTDSRPASDIPACRASPARGGSSGGAGAPEGWSWPSRRSESGVTGVRPTQSSAPSLS